MFFADGAPSSRSLGRQQAPRSGVVPPQTTQVDVDCGMYDLHAHILPAVDDGPKSMEDAVEMARVAFEHGTRVILATPHRKDVTENLSVAHIQDVAVDLRGELDSKGIDLEVLLGMENHLDLDLPEEYARGRALPINGSRYALVELPFFGYPNYAEEVLFQLQLKGVTPVLAHPERIEAFQRNPELLVAFVEKGMLSQITGGEHRGRLQPQGKARHS